MEVTEQDIERIPRRNMRVPVAEFAQLWVAPERRNQDQTARGIRDWYAGGVMVTCRCIVATTAREPDRWCPAFAPVTHRSGRVYDELIEAEFFAAETLDLKTPRPEWLAGRPSWSEAIYATLRWAGRRSVPTPLEPNTTGEH